MHGRCHLYVVPLRCPLLNDSKYRLFVQNDGVKVKDDVEHGGLRAQGSAPVFRVWVDAHLLVNVV